MEIYDVFLNTPLGKKYGELSACIENGKLMGFLSLLGHTESIEGTVDEDGNCAIKGKFITLLNTIYFTADGMIKRGVLDLNIRSDSNTYEMKGTLRGEKEQNSEENKFRNNKVDLQ